MLTGPKLKILQDLVGSYSKEELIWVNGYISGQIDNAGTEITVHADTPVRKMTIVYGTETGNSKKLATDLATKAKKKSVIVKLASLDQYRLTDITKEENLFVIISTQGDGEPPIAAKKFYDHIHHNGFRLEQLKFSVLALGDTSYPLFCKTGEEVDEQLHKMGGKRMLPIKKCDVDYEADAEAWFTEVLETLHNAPAIAAPSLIKTVPQTAVKSNKKIYTANVLSNINLNDRGSSKETYHMELFVDEEVDYLPGDSIGIVPENPVTVVNAIIDITGISKDKLVKHKETDYTVFDLLKKKLNISFLHERVVKKYAAMVQQEIPETKMDLIDLLRIYPVKDATVFEEVLQALPAQSPRIFTIASSHAAHSGEVHLTVEKHNFSVNEISKTGICSDYLAQVKPNDTFEFFVQKNKRFKLPAADKDILMIGPGTGIAAFRSFISERDATGATGKNWLFFGEEHFVSDFLYQTEIQNWFETGVLTKVNLAFSKDQPEKVFVHHRLLEHGKEVYDWIASGTYTYVCGEKAPMSVEVENTLLTIFENHGGFSKEAAKEYFEKLKEEGMYSKDVY